MINYKIWVQFSAKLTENIMIYVELSLLVGGERERDVACVQCVCGFLICERERVL